MSLGHRRWGSKRGAPEVGSEQGPGGSLAVNQTVTGFDLGIVWGARPHPSQNGGLLVDGGPLLLACRSPRRRACCEKTCLLRLGDEPGIGRGRWTCTASL